MSSAGHLVLIVDDDIDLLEALALILERRGYRVLTATSGDKALEVLQETPLPSLILFDLMMPGMNGWSLRQKLLDKAAYASIPAVVLSGDHTALQNTPPPGCARTLRKPIDLATLLDVVKHACG
jgi:two-component system, chemotaxis family, chemotaxis protein CheY